MSMSLEPRVEQQQSTNHNSDITNNYTVDQCFAISQNFEGVCSSISSPEFHRPQQRSDINPTMNFNNFPTMIPTASSTINATTTTTSAAILSTLLNLTSMESRLVAFQMIDQELEHVPMVEKMAYYKARHYVPDIVMEESCPLWFLQYEQYDVPRATQRLLRYWNWRYLAFGNEQAYKRVLDITGSPTNSAFQPDDVDALLCGGLSLLPTTDGDGNSIIVYNRSRFDDHRVSLNETEYQRMRIAFFIWTCAMKQQERREQHEQEQKHQQEHTTHHRTSHNSNVPGVILLNIVLATPRSFIKNNKVRKLAVDAMPIALKHAHIVFHPTHRNSNGNVNNNNNANMSFSFGTLVMQSVFLPFIQQTMKLFPSIHVTIHNSCTLDVLKKRLLNFGLQEHNYPTEIGGTWRYTEFYTWLAQQCYPQHNNTLNNNSQQQGLVGDTNQQKLIQATIALRRDMEQLKLTSLTPTTSSSTTTAPSMTGFHTYTAATANSTPPASLRDSVYSILSQQQPMQQQQTTNILFQSDNVVQHQMQTSSSNHQRLQLPPTHHALDMMIELARTEDNNNNRLQSQTNHTANEVVTNTISQWDHHHNVNDSINHVLSDSDEMIRLDMLSGRIRNNEKDTSSLVQDEKDTDSTIKDQNGFLFHHYHSHYSTSISYNRDDFGIIIDQRVTNHIHLHWSVRKSIFGENTKFPMNQTGSGALSTTDLKTLDTGFLMLLPDDRLKRPVLFFTPSRIKKGVGSSGTMSSTESQRRCMYYMLYHILTTKITTYPVTAKNKSQQQQHTQKQQHGHDIVFIIFMNDEDHEDMNEMEVFLSIVESFPLKIASVHVFMETVGLGWFAYQETVQKKLDHLFGTAAPVPSATAPTNVMNDDVVNPKYNKSCLINYYTMPQSKTRLGKALSESGLQPKNLPVCLGGTVNDESFLTWQKQTVQIEMQNSNSSSTSNTNATNPSSSIPVTSSQNLTGDSEVSSSHMWIDRSFHSSSNANRKRRM